MVNDNRVSAEFLESIGGERRTHTPPGFRDIRLDWSDDTRTHIWQMSRAADDYGVFLRVQCQRGPRCYGVLVSRFGRETGRIDCFTFENSDQVQSLVKALRAVIEPQVAEWEVE